MIDIRVNELIEAINGTLLKGDSSLIVNSISIDSRKIKKDDLFIPICGEQFDGHEFIASSLNSGAIGAILDRDIDLSKYDNESYVFIRVKDTTMALQELAQFILNKLDIPVVAVTGSTGKTTTKELIHCVLSQEYNVLKNEGNFNNHIGLPLTLLNLKPEHQIAVLEMGMSSRGEIDRLANITRPQVGVITNIGLSHIEKLGSQSEILEAKMEISNYMNEESTLILNGDDALLGGFKNVKIRPSTLKRIFIGMKNDNDICVTKLLSTEDRIEFEISINNSLHDFYLNVPGEHNVLNSLLAIAVGIHFKVPISKIKRGISSFRSSKMRLHIIKVNNNIKVINDCYNASPDSMLSALKVLKQISCNKRIAILGDMFEMGSYSEQAHEEVGKMLINNNVDVLITVGSDSKYIGVGASNDGFPIEKIYNCDSNINAINVINNIVESHDAILIKGSRGMKMEEIVQSLQERC